MRQLLAAWMVVSEQDLSMNPRLLGKPGVGKTTLAYAAGRRMGRDGYILQATLDTRPEEMVKNGFRVEIRFHAQQSTIARGSRRGRGAGS